MLTPFYTVDRGSFLRGLAIIQAGHFHYTAANERTEADEIHV